MADNRHGARKLGNAVRPVIEHLESRQLLSVSLSSHGMLKVTGTRHADVITVSPDATTPGMIDVSVNGKVSTFAATKIAKIKINGAAGNDTITEDASISDPSTLMGGAGNDTITAGAGNDSLDGGAGNDSLVAGSGTDSLTGDAGNDSLQGGDGHCLLNGGKGKGHVGFTPAAGVPVSQVPAAVATGLTTLAQGATITTVQVFQDDGQTYYGTVVSINGADTRIVVDAKGNPVANGSNGQGEQGGPAEHGGAFGSVVSVDATANKITLKVTSEHSAAKQTTFTVAAGATITVDGAATPLGSLTAGTWVAVETSSTDPTTVTSITAFGRRVEGTVSAVDTTANTITLTGHEGGTPTTYKVSATATITFNGATAPLSSITVNSEALLKLSALDPT
ncbi:MAG: Hemolysin-type calcium-binding protein, partial [Phycisphaerales bacterium]|nr:Hemolysin-type calcium-binding protein [Phycisphaerales bacterium]